uniref:Cytochrome-c oxidase n=1 Tax=Acrobeloides nanus TaxID=290746 RepID=A0A914CUK9_9BILA
MAIGESFDACYYGVLEILGIDKYITVFSGSGFTTIFGGMIGIPSTPSFLPGMLAGMPPFSYVDRAKNLFTTVLMNW